jgi:hypothetical protein
MLQERCRRVSRRLRCSDLSPGWVLQGVQGSRWHSKGLFDRKKDEDRRAGITTRARRSQ